MDEATLAMDDPTPAKSREAEAQRIVALSDPVLRNLCITQMYHELDTEMSLILGESDVRWCAFATWASKTAGRFIRREEVPSLLETFLIHIDYHLQHVHSVGKELARVHGEARVGHGHVFTALDRVIDSITQDIAAGNLKVFAELAPIFARWIDTFGGAADVSQEAVHAFLATLRPGEVQNDGQDLLISAFSHYCDAITETDPAAKAQHLMLANAQVGYHEQIRLQDAIAGSLNAPVAHLLMDVARHDLHARIPTAFHATLDRALLTRLHPIAEAIEEEWQGFATHWLMRMEVPEGTLNLGRDVPALPDGTFFPVPLTELSNPHLLAFLDHLQWKRESLAGTAAHDWCNLTDRMNYIVGLFRSRQQATHLWNPPFAYEQVSAFKAGRMPPGKL